MSDRGIVLAQARMAILVALRTPRAIIFTVAFPLILLVLFNSIFIKGGDDTTTLPNDVRISAQAYFTAGIIAYSVALSTFTTLAVSLTTQRERGQLKRYRGTPMPPWTFIAAQIARATAQALSMTALLLGGRRPRLRGPDPRLDLPRLRPLRGARHGDLCSLGIALTRLHPHPRRRLDDRPLHRRHPRLLLRHLDPGRPAARAGWKRSARSSRSTTWRSACRPRSRPDARRQRPRRRKRRRPGDLGAGRRPHRQPPLPLGAAGRAGLRSARTRRPEEIVKARPPQPTRRKWRWSRGRDRGWSGDARRARQARHRPRQSRGRRSVRQDGERHRRGHLATSAPR